MDLASDRRHRAG